MKLNIFCVPGSEVEPLRAKLTDVGMTIIHTETQDGWAGQFFYSTAPYGTPAGWGKTFANYFTGDIKPPSNRSFWAAYVFTKGDRCYVLSYGKSHFFIRPYCDYDFGIEVAKRIANEGDIRQTASRRFQGSRKKDIRSFAHDTALDVESGEAVDYLQSGIDSKHRVIFGATGKFGTSVLLSPTLQLAAIGGFFTELESIMRQLPRFPIPRTTKITEAAEVARFDELLLDELTSEIGTSDFTHNSYDLFGVDFVFSNDGTFTIRAPGKPKMVLEHLNMGDLKEYVRVNKLERTDILRIRVAMESDESPGFNRPLKETLDFIADDERVVLSGGKWMHFNQDYLDFLDEAVSMIELEAPEDQFAHITVSEPAFNSSEELKAAGYVVADKDFDVLQTKSSTPVEAWDLHRGKTVYAVKFGTPQKLNYVVDQSTATLELLRNRANVNKVPHFERYCLWIGYRGKKKVERIADTGSIIFKQKLEAWARKAREVGVVPVLKISQTTKPGLSAKGSVH